MFWDILEFICLVLNSKVNKKPLLKSFSVLEMKYDYLTNSQKSGKDFSTTSGFCISIS